MLRSWHGERVRHVYEPRGPRDFRPSRRDSEARPGSPQGRCEEPTSARAKAEAQIFLPRFKRQGLVNRFSLPTSNLCVSESLADDLRDHQIKPISVIHGIFLGRTIVESTPLFIKVSE